MVVVAVGVEAGRAGGHTVSTVGGVPLTHGSNTWQGRGGDVVAARERRVEGSPGLLMSLLEVESSWQVLLRRRC